MRCRHRTRFRRADLAQNVQVLEARLAPAVFVVTTPTDSGVGSFREALQLSNSNPGADTIQFQIPNAQSIEILSPLPVIIDPVTIDGTTQPGYAGTPLVELDGKQITANGLTVNVAGCTFIALNIHGFTADGIRLESKGNHVVTGCYIGTDRFGAAALGNGGVGIYISGPNNVVQNCLISGNAVDGIRLDQLAATNNVIRGNFIGLNAVGTTRLANLRHGVAVISAPGNRIGGTTAGDRNVISGNGGTGFYGVLVSGEPADNNVILGNYIGTDASGTKAVGNALSGVFIELGADSNTIGGNVAGSGNVISGNLDRGVTVAGSGTNGTVIAGNVIGLNAAGAAKLANVNAGIRLDAGATGTRIGTNSDGINDAAEGNVVSGNTTGINAVSAPSTLIAGNIIGLNAAGLQSLGNNGNGVVIDANSDGSTIGGTALAARNVVGGNAGYGLFLNGADGTIVIGNYIGTDSTGNVARPNTAGGISIEAYSTANAFGNRIGGTEPGAGNLISGNSVFGVRIREIRDVDGFSSPAGSNVIIGNRIGTNAAGTAALPNTGNGVQIQAGADNNRVGANGDGTNDAAEANLISGNTGSGILISGIGANANVVAGNRIGTDATGALAVPNGVGITIQGGARNNRIGTNGDGISDDLEANVISGNAGDGVVVLGLDAGSFTERFWPVSAGGNNRYYVLTPVTSWTNAQAAAIAAGGHLVSIADSPLTTGAVENLYVDGNLRPSGSHIWIGLTDDAAYGGAEFGNTGGSVVGSSGVRGKGFVWVDGSVTPWPAPPGFQNWDNAQPDNFEQNEHAVSMRTNGKWNDLRQSNLLQAVLEFASDPDLDLLVPFFTTANNTVAGNRLGVTNADAALGNGGRGVFIDRAIKTTIGGPSAGLGNVIANNSRGGVLVVNALSVGNAIRGNQISGNLGLGIDLSLAPDAAGFGDGVTSNDPGDADVGPNGFLNFPRALAAGLGTNTRVVGTLNSTPNTDFAIDVFASQAADPSGHGEGQRYLGNISVRTDPTGAAFFDEVLPAATTAGEAITFTATDKLGNNTSEFSNAWTTPTQVTSAVVNGGSAQRSRVTAITVNFNQPPVFLGEPNTAFQLVRQSDSAAVALAAQISGSSVTLSFTGGPVEFGSLADGRYTLRVLASKLPNIDGNGDGTPGDDYALVGTPANGLYRLFGDADGNGQATVADFLAFRLAFLSPSPAFDFDNNGAVDAGDFLQFRLRFLQSV